ncbi:Rieske (2Fe-2S) protein [Mycolicibacterium sp. GCM10028919]|uniref:Rieske (2Fe-2S) protein n=1 Tax=Mycolicibacterium sp. GCM10028919 TaxID=3273401 RepID=UPI00361A7CCA
MPVELTPPSRRTVLACAGVGIAAATMTACSTYGDEPEPAAPSGGAPAALAATADVPVGSGVILDDVVLTQPTAGVFKGFSKRCPHAGCSVSEITDGNIVCPCHGSRFDLEGAVVNGPAASALSPKAVTVQGDSIVEG